MATQRSWRMAGAALAVLPLLVGACGGSSTAGNTSPIVIGALYPLTGDNAGFGGDSLAAIQTAADILNNQGGVNGRKVQIVPADVTTAEEAQAAAQRLITQQHIHVLMGTTFSFLGIPASAEADRLGALYWDTVDASPMISSRGLKHVFQFAPHADVDGQWGADFVANGLAKQLGKPASSLRVGVTYTNDSFGSAVGQASAAEAQKDGLQVVVNESYDPKVTDLTTLILKLKGANVDVVLQSTMQPDSVLFNKQLRQQDFNPIIVAALGYDNPSTVQALGACINGVFNESAPQFSAIDPNQLTAEGKQINLLYGPMYTQRTGRPQSVDSDQTFSAAWVFLDHVLKVVGDDSNVDSLAAQARKLDLPLGSLANGFGYHVDSNNYNTRTVVAITEWQDQKEQTVYPPNITKTPITLVPRPAWSSVCS